MYNWFSELQTQLNSGELSLGVAFVAIILLSYLLEDVAIVTAAGLATQQLMSPEMALLAIFVGIVTGDIALYCLGKYGRRVRALRYRALTNKSFRFLRRRLHQGAVFNLFIIRFIPGLRTMGFTLSGFFSVPFPVFFSAVMAATALWTLCVFFVLYSLGSSAWLQVSGYQWVVVPLAILALFLINRVLNKSLLRGQS
ncbi:DedA family protein [Vibrio spartinae]|uniref:DedA family protein n=1 Tax=Vibrio spartinae TaxID=1918945 RepID=UPI001F26053C|nr:VTT domain-containing protein [Vibrio spartinae]